MRKFKINFIKLKKAIKHKRIMLVLLLPLSYLMTYLAKNNIVLAELYATHIYPYLAQGISYVTGIVPFSVGEILSVLAFSSIVIYTLFSIIKAIKNKRKEYLVKYIINMTVLASCLYFLFVIFCGINYYRYEFSYYSGLEVKKSSQEELVELCHNLIEQANNLRVKIQVDDTGIATLNDKSGYGTANRAQSSFNNISAKYQVLKGTYSRPKPVIFSNAMSHMQISGVFFPFTFEANVNKDIPKFQLPATMCHELVHLRGFMREDEANFISYLACINSGYDDFAYSGTMLALTYSMNALYSEDYDEFKKLYSEYSEAVRRDLKYSSDYWKQFDTKIAKISSKVNDAYLKANSQEDGVKSYGRMVDLLLAEQREKSL